MRNKKENFVLLACAQHLLVLIFVPLVGCNGASNDVTDPCKGINCSDHGECAVSDGNVLCLCESGYHADGIECVVDKECTGVDCSGHGTCAVLAGDTTRPYCLCDKGFYAVEDTTCEPIDVTCGPGTHKEDNTCVPDGSVQEGCASNEDCTDSSGACSLTGDCVQLQGAVCGLPPTGGGDRAGLARCTLPEEPCQEGLTCVPIRHEYNISDNSEKLFGWCMTPCDPCQPQCDSGRWCVAMPEGGGFCLGKELAMLPGLGCDSREDAMCGNGLDCVNDPSKTDFYVCETYCWPDAPISPANSALSATTSPDCPSGYVCHLDYADAAVGDENQVFIHAYCVPGTLLEAGEQCGKLLGEYCRAPLMCKNGTCQ